MRIERDKKVVKEIMSWDDVKFEEYLDHLIGDRLSALRRCLEMSRNSNKELLRLWYKLRWRK